MKRKYIIILVAALLMPLMAGAQALKGSYFIDNSLNRNKMNPAFAPRSNYFQMPGIGNLSVGAMSNLDVPTFLYPTSNGLVTFLNSQVSVDQFEKRLPNHPHFDAEVSTNLINFGFYTKQKSFWTVDISVKAGMDTDLPADLFLFLKKGTGTSGQSYNIANINAYATASLQAAVGYSRDIFDGLRVGAKVRFIAPMAYAALNLENVRLTTGKDKWTIETEGYVHAAVQGLETKVPAGEVAPEVEFDMNRMLQNKVLAGFGYAVDLGAEYVLDLPGTLFDGISVSAAVTDLGLVHYNKNAVNSFSTKGKIEWVGLQDMAIDEMENVDAAFEDFTSKAEDLLNLKKENSDGFVRSTMPNVFVGVEVPFLYNRMSAGLLYSGRFSHSYYRNELTASLNITPLKWLALGVNYSFLNTARTIGGILELTPKAGMNFFLGFDYLPLAFAPAPMIAEGMLLPMSLRMNLHFGLSVALGSKYGR